jgi:hypothetical protein
MIDRRIDSVIASEAKQSRGDAAALDCFVATLLAMTAAMAEGARHD